MPVAAVTASVVEGLVLKVTVIAPFPPKTRLHGFVVPEQADEEALLTRLQPENVDAELAAALRVIVAPLSEVVMLAEHVFVTV